MSVLAGAACPTPGVVASRGLSAAPQVSPGLASRGRRVHPQELARTGAEPGVAGETQPPRAPLTDAGSEHLPQADQALEEPAGRPLTCRQTRPWRSLPAGRSPKPCVLRAEKSQPLCLHQSSLTCPLTVRAHRWGPRGDSGRRRPPASWERGPTRNWPRLQLPEHREEPRLDAPSAVFRCSGL